MDFGGDFNVARFIGERAPREGYYSTMEEFDQFIINSNLIEIPLSNREFTWCNNRESPSFSLLDRLFVSDEIGDKFPICRVSGLPYTLSDHCPIILTCDVIELLVDLLNLKKCGF